MPYLSHLLGVASITLEFGATEGEAIAALLHDALEDDPENIQTYVARRGETREELRRVIRQEFGEQIERLVVGAPEDTALIEGRKAPWPERKEAYLQELIRSENPGSAASPLVSASDKLHNARAILANVLTFDATPQSRAPFFDRFNAGQTGTLQYYRLLVREYRRAHRDSRAYRHSSRNSTGPSRRWNRPAASRRNRCPPIPFCCECTLPVHPR
ncbi:HD domain-containing protein [Deinococcus daejeonensis]|uniref:Metal dependent phosphohydrolase n=1 Tax=Deinococcus daejeonensis TaxID=1007098 RepID=A0ABQ2JHU9_9DEIO|nr:HD domain-containing protein [Deinococcus daejeonensis]GGN47115.1 hypothetical protein GCM10010842_38330 [Deinococcus daejeonensis]